MPRTITLISYVAGQQILHPVVTEHQKHVVKVAQLLGLQEIQLTVYKTKQTANYRLEGQLKGQRKSGLGITPGRALDHLRVRVGISREALAEAWQEVNW